MTAPLDFDKLEPGYAFPPVRLRVSAPLLREYELAVGRTGGASTRVPPALLAVLARRAYLAEASMPPGGVLLRQDLSWRRAVEVGEEIEGRAAVLAREGDSGSRPTVAVGEAGDGRRAVTIRSVLHDPIGAPLATATGKIAWPPESPRQDGERAPDRTGKPDSKSANGPTDSARRAHVDDALESQLIVSQGAIDRWAELSGDRNPLHLDPAAARAAGFPAPIAHGQLALALIAEQLSRHLSEPWECHGALHDVRFRAPLHPNRRYTLAAASFGISGERGLELRDRTDGHLCIEGVVRSNC